MENIKIEYNGESVIMTWDGAQASAPIYVDGEVTQYQTASARHRRGLAVALVARHVWPYRDWPHVPSTGSIPSGWEDGSAAWEELSWAVEIQDAAPAVAFVSPSGLSSEFSRDATPLEQMMITAGEHGDHETVTLCRRAIGGDAAALAKLGLSKA